MSSGGPRIVSPSKTRALYWTDNLNFWALTRGQPRPNASKGLSASPGQEKRREGAGRQAGEHRRFGFSPTSKFSSSFVQFCPSLGLFATTRGQSGDYRGPDKFQKPLTPLIIQRKNQFYIILGSSVELIGSDFIVNSLEKPRMHTRPRRDNQLGTGITT
ncbi:hypothetical protein FVEG_14825 [Fusarium verticillioides 7600]|uniref:Uncharacterized protein n=1 Tax=Gibberella moniliformis (strain M3125 / FGSC 7600) TaxID=334819 RepID=W7LRD2_GIBM7|nr:hypothetical protein FVEG_14825 [Fusarium verticillioides 7600]EWG38025.1 hypothetical protein FVEG_14825 [Fusarium verticillioides 7600]